MQSTDLNEEMPGQNLLKKLKSLGESDKTPQQVGATNPGGAINASTKLDDNNNQLLNNNVEMNNVEPVHEEVEPVEPDNNEMHQEMEPPLEQEQQANNENSDV